jgi:hypothetical protein
MLVFLISVLFVGAWLDFWTLGFVADLVRDGTNVIAGSDLLNDVAVLWWGRF